MIWALRHDHPGFRYHRAYAARAVALSDLIPLHQWKKTKLYNEVYSKLGMHEQMIGVLPYARPDLCGVIVNRTRRTFTERDRTVLNIVRFHVSGACRTAKMHAPIPSPELTGAFEPVVGGGIIVLNTTGAVQFCSELSQRYLETFFSTEKPFHGGLPLTVTKWVHHESALFKTHELAVRPPQPLNVLQGGKSLQIRLSSTSNGTVPYFTSRRSHFAIEEARFSRIKTSSDGGSVLVS